MFYAHQLQKEKEKKERKKERKEFLFFLATVVGENKIFYMLLKLTWIFTCSLLQDAKIFARCVKVLWI